MHDRTHAMKLDPLRLLSGSQKKIFFPVRSFFFFHMNTRRDQQTPYFVQGEGRLLIIIAHSPNALEHFRGTEICSVIAPFSDIVILPLRMSCPFFIFISSVRLNLIWITVLHRILAHRPQIKLMPSHSGVAGDVFSTGLFAVS